MTDQWRMVANEHQKASLKYNIAAVSESANDTALNLPDLIITSQ